MKFGGAVLRSPQGFRDMADILTRESDKPILVVVSAFATSTRDLEFAARLAAKGLAEDAMERLNHVMDDHKALIRDVIAELDVRSALDALIDEVRRDTRQILKGVSITRQLTPRTLDTILATGEFLALHIATHMLRCQGINVASLDVRAVLVTDSVHGAARPLSERTHHHVHRVLRPLLEVHDVVVVQGFVGQTEQGDTTTMGKESSNLTATLLGSLLGCTEVVIWTDVEGVRSGDPHVCTDTRLRPHLTYTEARLAAINGVKVLYPTMIDPVEAASIPLRIAMASRADYAGTVISKDGPPCGAIVVCIESDTTESDVIVLFPDGRRWLEATADMICSRPEVGSLALSLDPVRQRATISVPTSMAKEMTSELHRRLIHQ